MASVLGETAKAAFDKEARSIPIEEGEETAPVVEHVEEPAPSPESPNAAEPAGATEPEAASGAGENPPADERKPQHVPYDRFKEVNDRNKELLTRQAEFEKQLADVDAAAKARSAQLMRQIAEQNPELRNYILGDGGDPVELETEAAPAPAAGAPAADPAGKPAADPVMRRLEQAEKRLALQEQYRVRQERDRALNDLQEKITAEMDRHPIFKDPELGAFGQRLVGREILTDPNKPYAQVVKEVAAQLKSAEEGIKAKYVSSKKTAAKTIPAGVGSGGAAPPGRQVQKASLTDGTTKKAFAAGLREIEAETK